MTKREPEPNDPLSPYYPSEIPSVPGSGRTWFAILLTLVLLFGTLYMFLSPILPW